MAGENNGNGNGNNKFTVNTAIFIWLGGLTIAGAFYSGMSLERLNTIKETQNNQERMFREEMKLRDIQIDKTRIDVEALKLVRTSDDLVRTKNK